MKLRNVASSGFFLVFKLGSDFLRVVSCAPKAEDHIPFLSSVVRGLELAIVQSVCVCGVWCVCVSV